MVATRLDSTAAAPGFSTAQFPISATCPPDVHKDWYQIVLGGSHWSKGMPGFADPPKFAFPHDKMTVQDADAIHAYVIAGAWKAYKSEQVAAQTKPEKH